MNKIRLYQVILIGIIAGEIIYLILAATGLAASDPAPGNDFWQHLYAAKAIRAGSSNLAPSGADLIYPYPPFVAILFMPLSFLPASLALCIWILILYLTIGGTAYFCARRFLDISNQEASLTVFSAIAWPVSFIAILFGQSTPLILGLLVLALALNTRKKELTAGFILSLALIKPQLIWAIPLGLLLKKKWRILTGFSLGAVPLLGVSAWLGKGNQLSDWQGYVSGWFLGNERSLSPVGRLYFLPSDVQLLLTLVGVVLLSIWWVSKPSVSLMDVSKGFLFSLLISPYLLVSDLILVMPVFIILSAKRTLIFWLSLILMSISILRFGLGDFVALSLILLAVLAWRYEIPSRVTVATN